MGKDAKNAEFIGKSTIRCRGIKRRVSGQVHFFGTNGTTTTTDSKCRPCLDVGIRLQTGPGDAIGLSQVDFNFRWRNFIGGLIGMNRLEQGGVEKIIRSVGQLCLYAQLRE